MGTGTHGLQPLLYGGLVVLRLLALVVVELVQLLAPLLLRVRVKVRVRFRVRGRVGVRIKVGVGAAPAAPSGRRSPR